MCTVYTCAKTVNIAYCTWTAVGKVAGQIKSGCVFALIRTLALL